MSRIKEIRKLVEQEEDNYMGGILARGYYTKENSKKIVDPTLILAMVKHLRKEGYHKHDEIDCTKCLQQPTEH